MTYQREITSNERLYMAAEPLCPPFVINTVVEATGSVQLEELRLAVEHASAACPGARLIARGGRWVDSGQTPPVRRGDIESTLRTRLDAERGPTCEVIATNGALLFRASQGVMDGKGLLVWMHDVFRALRGEALVGATSTITDQALVERLGPGKGRKFDFDCPPPFGPLKYDHDYVWKRRNLSGTHPALVARIAAAVCEERTLRIMVPVDLRRHATDISSTGNLSMPIFLDVRRGESWEELEQRLSSATSARAELTRNDMDGISGLLPGFGLKAMVRMAIALQRAKGKFLLASSVIAHLGRVELSALSAPGFAARSVYSLPPHVPLAPLALALVDCGAHVELCLTCSAGSDVVKQADALLDRIVAALDARS